MTTLKIIALAAFLLAALMAPTAQIAAPSHPVSEFDRYLPAGAVAYAEVADLGHLLGSVIDSRFSAELVKSAAWQDFTVSKLYNKIGDRLGSLEEATGFGLTLDNLRAVAGGRSAVALYDLGELKFVFLTRMPMEKIAASELWGLREQFEERTTDAGQQYYVKEDEIGHVGLAFASAGDLFVVGTDVPRFEETLALIKGAGSPLGADGKFTEAFSGEGMSAGDIAIYLDQEAISKTPYFSNYWFYGNAAELAGIRRVGISVSIAADGIRENRTVVRAQNGPVMSGDPALLVAALPSGCGYYECGELTAGGGLATLVKGMFNGIDDAAAARIAAAVAPAVGDAYAAAFGFSSGASPLQRTLDAALVIRLAKPAALNRATLETAIAAAWEEKLLYAGQGSLNFSDANGVRALTVPLFEGAAPAWKLSGDLLILSSSARFISGPARGAAKDFAAAHGCRFAFQWSARQMLGDANRYFALLAGRSNWNSADNARFFSGNVPSLFNLLGFVDEVTMQRTAGGTVEREQVYYRFAATR